MFCDNRMPMEVKDDQFEQESGTQDGLRIFRAERVERKPQRKVFPDWNLPEQGEGTRCGEEGRGLGFGWASFNKSEGTHFQRGPVAARSSRGNQLIARADYLLSLRETVNFFVPALLLYTTTLVTFRDSLTFALTPIHFGLSSSSTP